MAASPQSSLYNYWTDHESHFQEEESIMTSIMGTKHSFIGDIWSCKDQNMIKEQNLVGDANRNRASIDYDMENANSLTENPHELGVLIPHLPINVDLFNDDSLNYPMAATPPSSLYNHWVDFDRLIGEEQCTGLNTLALVAHEQGGSLPHVPIDVDASDDEVLVSSSRDFIRAKNKSKRSRETAVIIDVESEEPMHTVTPGSHDEQMIIPSGQAIIDCDLYECLAGPSRIVEELVVRVEPPLLLPPPPPPPSPPPAPPVEPVFSCPICMCSIEEASSTKCGHIFCKACLKAAISAQKKCPTCRAKVATMRSTFRVYLPTTR